MGADFPIKLMALALNTLAIISINIYRAGEVFNQNSEHAELQAKKYIEAVEANDPEFDLSPVELDSIPDFKFENKQPYTLAEPIRDPKLYYNFIQEVEDRRDELNRNNQRIRKREFNETLETMLDYWYGTNYQFDSCTYNPSNGTIDCGHFVSMVLHQLGFNFNRRKMSVRDSATIVNSFCEPQTIKRFWHQKKWDMEAYFRENGDGFYLVGLDMHAGIMQRKNGETYFIHANPFVPEKVVKERFSESLALQATDLILIGRLYSKKLSEKYVKGEYFQVDTYAWKS